MRALFLGTFSPFTAAPLAAWLDGGNEVAEFWYPDQDRQTERRRDQVLQCVAPRWSIGRTLQRYNIGHRAVGSLRKSEALQQRMVAVDADVLICAGFPFVVPGGVLDYYGSKAINFHPSLLPRYRGPLPIAWMLYQHDAETCGGMTMHQMSAAVDAGAIVAQQAVPWRSDDTFRKWEVRLYQAAARMTRDVLPKYLCGEVAARPQPGDGDYYRMLMPHQLLLGPQLTAERMQHLIHTIGGFHAMEAEVGGKRYRVNGLRVLGPATEKRARIREASIEFDCADARVRLSRWQPWTPLKRKVGTMLRFATASLYGRPDEPAAGI